MSSKTKKKVTNKTKDQKAIARNKKGLNSKNTKNKKTYDKIDIKKQRQKRSIFNFSSSKKPYGVRNQFAIMAVCVVVNIIFSFNHPEKYKFLLRFDFGWGMLLIFNDAYKFIFFQAVIWGLAIVSFFPRWLFESKHISKKVMNLWYYSIFCGFYVSLFFSIFAKFSCALALEHCVIVLYLSLKTHSWIHTIENQKREEGVSNKQYFLKYIYFLMVPVIVYSNRFEMKDKRRIWYMFYKLFSFLIGTYSLGLIYLNYMEPVLSESTDTRYWKLPLDVWRLTVPVIVFWWVSFLTFFRGFLKLVAEILKCKDNKFYEDWWNADNLQDFWRKWNLMFHKFARNHIFSVLVKTIKMNPALSLSGVFLISGILHEIIIDYTLRVWSFQWFIGFLVQIPAVYIQSKLPKSLSRGDGGNVLYWLVLFFGLPSLAIWYRRTQILQLGDNI
ncbi:sterol o-acyltransferase [Anaeramoeba flamelloides]|uniref:O-acyltransferase n=1 Tax=Anaeramoeba flamelloides TaxID=1746091 RepID=A0ABQ8XNU4_9EUKA|nr:sterol o-acyltransferase [Anaeramoeba flamelloides]